MKGLIQWFNGASKPKIEEIELLTVNTFNFSDQHQEKFREFSRFWPKPTTLLEICLQHLATEKMETGKIPENIPPILIQLVEKMILQFEVRKALPIQAAAQAKIRITTQIRIQTIEGIIEVNVQPPFEELQLAEATRIQAIFEEARLAEATRIQTILEEARLAEVRARESIQVALNQIQLNSMATAPSFDFSNLFAGSPNFNFFELRSVIREESNQTRLNFETVLPRNLF